MQLPILLLVLFLFQTNARAEDRPTSRAPGVNEISNVLKTNLEIYHLAPIVVPQGEKVGDLIDLNSGSLIAGAEECFPKLKPRAAASMLPEIAIASERELAAALGVDAGNVANADGSKRIDQKFSLDFDNVRVERVSVLQLRIALKRKVPECELVRPFLERGARLISDRQLPLLIGMIFFARRVIHVTTTDTRAAEAKVSLVDSLMKKLGLHGGFKAEARGEEQTSTNIDIVAKEIVPVAFAPALVIDSIRHANNGRPFFNVRALDYATLQRLVLKSRNSSEESRYASEQEATEPARVMRKDTLKAAVAPRLGGMRIAPVVTSSGGSGHTYGVGF